MQDAVAPAAPPPTRRRRAAALLRRVLGAVVLVVAAPVGLLTLLGFFGAWWWVLDLSASFRLQYAVLLVAATVLLVVLRWRRAALVIGVLALVDVALVAPLWLGGTAEPDGDARLRVLFHNVHGGGEERFEAVAEELARSDADVVVVAEVGLQWIDHLRQRADLPYVLVHPRWLDDHRRIMVLSRVPVRAVAPVPLVPDARAGGIAVEVLLDGRPVRVLGVHVTSPRGGEDADRRNRELVAVGDWVRAQDVPVVVVGDLNTTSWSHAFRLVRDGTKLRDSQLGHGFQPTWPVGTEPLMVPIDHVLHDPELTVTERRRGPSLGSAHTSLTATLAWREGS